MSPRPTDLLAGWDKGRVATSTLARSGAELHWNIKPIGERNITNVQVQDIKLVGYIFGEGGGWSTLSLAVEEATTVTSLTSTTT